MQTVRAWPAGTSMALGVAVALLICLAPVCDVDAVPNPVPVLTLSLTPTQLQARVTNTQNGPVMFGGNATVEIGVQALTVTVTLSASCIWPAIVSPSTMTFRGSGTQQFWVTVVVPPKTSALDIGQLIVSGTAKAPGMPTVVSTANAVVTVAQYYMFELGTRNDTLYGAAPGGTVTGRFNINNTGNGLDTFSISTKDPEGVVAHSSARMSVDVREGESAAIDFLLTMASDASYPVGSVVRVEFLVTSVEAELEGLPVSQSLPFMLVFGAPPAVPPDTSGNPEGNETGYPDADGGSGAWEAVTALTIVTCVVLVVAVSVLSTRRRRPAADEAVEVPVEVEPSPVQT